ncbi:MAG: FkbM family methyltransferase [Candidatus Atabeyarchaeum deiterrae]
MINARIGRRKIGTLVHKPAQSITKYKNKIRNGLRSRILGYRVPTLGHNYEEHFHVEKNSVVLDVGANIGLFTLSVAKRAGLVVAIEPEPKNLSALHHNLRNLTNVVIMERAAWDRKGVLPLFLGLGSEGHSLIHDIEVNGKLTTQTDHLQIEADTLDSMVLHELGILNIGFMKMDIEGAEIEALEGATETLKKTSKVVVACYHERNGTKTAGAVTRKLTEMGFQTYVGYNDLVFGLRIANH